LDNLFRIGSLNVNGNWSNDVLLSSAAQYMQKYRLDFFALLDTRIINKIDRAKNLIYKSFPQETYYVKIFPALSLTSTANRASSVGGQVLIIRRNIPGIAYVRSKIDPSGCGVLSETLFERTSDRHKYRILSVYAPSKPTSSAKTSLGLWNKIRDYLARTQAIADPNPLHWIEARIKHCLSSPEKNTVVVQGDLNQTPTDGADPSSFLGSLISVGLTHHWYLKLLQHKCDLTTFPKNCTTIDHILTNAEVQLVVSGGIGISPHWGPGGATDHRPVWIGLARGRSRQEKQQAKMLQKAANVTIPAHDKITQAAIQAELEKWVLKLDRTKQSAEASSVALEEFSHKAVAIARTELHRPTTVRISPKGRGFQQGWSVPYMRLVHRMAFLQRLLPMRNIEPSAPLTAFCSRTRFRKLLQKWRHSLNALCIKYPSAPADSVSSLHPPDWWEQQYNSLTLSLVLLQIKLTRSKMHYRHREALRQQIHAAVHRREAAVDDGRLKRTFDSMLDKPQIR
jgi:hypothetical protein